MRYVAIRSEGGLIPYDLLDKIANEDVPGQKPSDFGLPKGRRLTDEISRVWSDAQSLWDIIRRRRESLSEKDPYGTTLTRDRWIVPLLSDAEMLGFDLKLQASGVVVDNLTFNLSHRSGDGDDAIPIHIEGLKIDLDKRLHTKLRTSPQAMVQEFLNHGEQVVWGVVTNGLTLRLLRDSSRTSRPTYVEFDLESILEGNRFAEFAIFYRLCHRSRFPKPGQEPSECLLEKYYQQSIDEGSRVREGLRGGVEETLKIFGNAFLQHPDNHELREKLTNKRLDAVQYHRQLLLLVYRLLFLMVAEERRLIVSQGEGFERNQRIYDEWYSVSRLRDRAAQIIEESRFGDVWLGLLQTFSLFEYGIDSNALGIPPLNGDLFNQDRAIPDLLQTQLYNHDLLRAVRHLSMFKADGLQQRVNYSALDVEELGSVYESLLDYQAVIETDDRGLHFDLRVGSERKSTGSYYTRPELVHELIESALVPVMQDRLAEAEKVTGNQALHVEREAKIKAILGMTVCDPACGSGHFLLAAARRLGKELARIKTGEDEPTPEQFHLAVREVIQHCIYGVDMNPLAVDLCKLAMWLEGHWAGRPLSFLDHRVRCGNSLIGILKPAVLEDGIPDDAFTAVTGDDKKVASHFKKRNKQERTSKQRGLFFESEDHGDEYAKANRELSEIIEDTAAAVRRKAELYSSWRAGMQHSHDECVADLWTSQFFLPLTHFEDNAVTTTKDFLEFSIDKMKKPQQVAAAQALAAQSRFFHWHLEFPEVFENGGFDVVLGNPPWERIKLQEEEHWLDDSYISTAPNKAIRARRLDEYRKSQDPKIIYRLSLFDLARHSSEAASKFIRESGRFQLTSGGDINTYALFAELARLLMRIDGRVGVIVPTGIVTDDTYKEFFQDLCTNESVVSVFDFENRDRLFPDVYYRMKFALLTISGSAISQASFGFYLTRPEHIRDETRRFFFSSSQIALVNPNTRTCPVFRTRFDAELTKKVYESVPVLDSDSTGGNHWGVRFLAMFHMAGDSELFRSKENDGLVALYEGKMLQAYDHRSASIILKKANINRDGQPELTSEAQHRDPNFTPTPRYWVELADVNARLKDWDRDWFLCFKDVASTTNERTCILTVLPRAGVGHTVPVILFNERDVVDICCFLANFDSLILDYIARQKLGGLHLTFGLLRQLPILPPSSYKQDDKNFIVSRVLKLVFTSHDLSSFARDLGYEGPPFDWNEDERACLICELDAYFAHLYGFSRQELGYILDPQLTMGEGFPGETFRTLREREIKQIGEYRTQHLVLEAFDNLSNSSRFRDEMPNRVSAFEVPERAKPARKGTN